MKCFMLWALPKAVNILRIAPKKEAVSLHQIWCMLFGLTYRMETQSMMFLAAGAGRFIIKFTESHYWIMSWARWFHSVEAACLWSWQLAFIHCSGLQCVGLNRHSRTASRHAICIYLLVPCSWKGCIEHLKVCHTLNRQPYENRVHRNVRYSDFGPNRILKI
jgi:hypothetical protein